jgi:hypothetical protein
MLISNMDEEQRKNLDTYLLSPEWDLIEPDLPNPNAAQVKPEEDPEWRPSWWVDNPDDASNLQGAT